MVFQFTFSGTTYIVAMASGVGGWTLIDHLPAGTDDVVIQSAVDYLATLDGGSLFIDRGIYNLTATINLPHSTTTYLPDAVVIIIYGAGWKTTLQLANNTNASMFICDNATYAVVGLTVRDIHLRGRATNQTQGSGFGAHTGNADGGEFCQCLWERVYFDDLRDYAIWISKEAGDAPKPYENIVRDCHIVSCNEGGIYLQKKAYDEWIGPNNLFYNNAADADGAALKMWTAVSNYVYGNVFAGGGNTHYGIEILYGRNWYILHNQFDDIARNCILLHITGDSEGLIGNGDISHNLFRSCSQETDNTYDVIYAVGTVTYEVEKITIFDNQYHNWGEANAPRYLVNFGANTNNNQVKGFRCDAGDVATFWYADAGVNNLLNKTGKACEIVTYQGDGGVANAITDAGFRVQVVWIWILVDSNSTTQHGYMKIAGMYADQVIRFKSTVAAEQFYQLDDHIESLDIDGFTVNDDGADDHPNKNGTYYIAICWPEI